MEHVLDDPESDRQGVFDRSLEEAARQLGLGVREIEAHGKLLLPPREEVPPASSRSFRRLQEFDLGSAAARIATALNKQPASTRKSRNRMRQKR